eukprot:CAMPEP_0194319154 /NCGR_PEP_ID=MMETSP0171-20130528/15638_1 /TAXON_ID=218684 /ORGANISM="Corethron pennatum, Strain L29A3" /LENGTH=838 /DNA_ID=CAMNT_0039076269 /DNA_START=86 /DNA_END=2602 /DNA_ORIENTATION=-
MSLLVRHQSVREDPKSKTIEDDLSLASSSVTIWEDEEIRSLPLSNQSYDLELCVVLYEVEVFSPRLEWHRSTRHQDMYPHWIRAHRRSIPKSSKTGSADERCPVLPRIHAHKKIDGEMWKWAPRSNWEIDRNRSRQMEIYAHSYNRIVVGPDAVDDEGWEYATELDRFYDPKRLPRGICKFTDRVRRRRWFRIVCRVQTNNKKIMDKKKIQIVKRPDVEKAYVEQLETRRLGAGKPRAGQVVTGSESVKSERLETIRIKAERVEADEEHLEDEVLLITGGSVGNTDASECKQGRPVAAAIPKRRLIEVDRLRAEQNKVEQLQAQSIPNTEEVNAAEAEEVKRPEAKYQVSEKVEAEHPEPERLAVRKMMDARERLEEHHHMVECLKLKRIEAKRIEAKHLEAERLKAQRVDATRLELDLPKNDLITLKQPERERPELESLKNNGIEMDRLKEIHVEKEKGLENNRIEAGRLEVESVKAEQIETGLKETARSAAERPKTEKLVAECCGTQQVERGQMKSGWIESEKKEGGPMETERQKVKRLDAEKANIESILVEAEQVEANEENLEDEAVLISVGPGGGTDGARCKQGGSVAATFQVTPPFRTDGGGGNGHTPNDVPNTSPIKTGLLRGRSFYTHSQRPPLMLIPKLTRSVRDLTKRFSRIDENEAHGRAVEDLLGSAESLPTAPSPLLRRHSMSAANFSPTAVAQSLKPQSAKYVPAFTSMGRFGVHGFEDFCRSEISGKAAGGLLQSEKSSLTAQSFNRLRPRRNSISSAQSSSSTSLCTTQSATPSPLSVPQSSKRHSSKYDQVHNSLGRLGVHGLQAGHAANWGTRRGSWTGIS